MKLTLTHDIISNLNEIVERLLSNHAAVMVGAGFSMNALKSSPEVKNFPSWTDLGDAFYRKVNGKFISQDNGRYLNALKLAEEVQAQFGRIVLDKILMQEIPDKKYNPSKLHNKLLQLPWNDVFTTNYDTLLERASQDVISRKYDVIVKNEDLVYSEKPRIIKLHGSFPSQRPFIITEEDYRIYPSMFAPFVNTVQQSLLENALCLIGFSGNDPNFLAWIGWIRDNLGKENSSKLYLIGVFDFSSAQRMLLEKRNIIILDFSECPDINHCNNKHEAALEAFLDYLLEAMKKKKEFDWLAGEKEFHINYIKNAEIKEIIKVWSKTRQTYPGWWILPEDLRKRLWKRTDHTLLREVASLKNTRYLNSETASSVKQDMQYNAAAEEEGRMKEEYVDLLYLYEYNWRQERCLIPLCLDQVKIYEEVINKYNPYPEKLRINGQLPSGRRYPIDKELADKWIDIELALLRYFRENNDLEKLKYTIDIINQLLELLSSEQLAKFNYEKCLMNLFQIRLSDIKDCLYEWKEDYMMPVWEAKRASIWAILGEVEIAYEIIGKALAEVRKQLMLVPVNNNYTMISQEAYLMFLSSYYQQVIHLKCLKNEHVFHDNYKERSAEHKKYKCDPFQEKRIFEIELSNEYIPRSERQTEHSFDIGHEVQQKFIPYDDGALLLGLELLRYLEEAGIPVSVGNVSYSAKIMANVLQRISYVNPYVTMIYTILYGDKKNTRYIFSRKSISEMDLSDIDNLCNTFLLQLKLCENEIKIGETFYTSNFGIRLAQILPEILSRLCVKCSSYIKYKIADFVSSVYSCGYPAKYDKMDKLIERLVKTCNEEDLSEIILKFITIPVNCDKEIHEMLVDPFIYINNCHMDGKFDRKLKINPQIIQNLLNSSEKCGLERKNAIIRLAFLWKNSQLTLEDVTSFAEALWSKKDEKTGLPIETYYSNAASFLELPAPENRDAEKQVKQYLLDRLEQREQEYRTVIQDVNHSFKYQTKNGDSCIWTREERLRIIGYILDYYKVLMKESEIANNTKSVHMKSIEEILQSINEFMELLMNLLLRQPRLIDITEDRKKELVIMIRKLEKEGVPCCKLKLTCKNILEITDANSMEKLLRQINSNELPFITDCLDSIFYYLLFNQVEREEASTLISLIVNQIVARRNESLYYSLYILNNIVSMIPEYLTEELFISTICGLEYLYEESQMSRNDTDYMVGIRAQAMGLAAKLHHFCASEGRKIPAILDLWKSASKSYDEFWEVRNSWN